MKDDVGTLIEPGAVHFTWGAPGWYVVGLLMLLLLVGVLIIIVHYYRKNEYRRTALAWLTRLEREFSGKPERLVYEATVLLKRIAMTRYGRKQAGIRDAAWIAFLNSSCKATLFTDADAQWITQALYASGTAISAGDVAQFIIKTRTWIKRHRYAL